MTFLTLHADGELLRRGMDVPARGVGDLLGSPQLGEPQQGGLLPVRFQLRVSFLHHFDLYAFNIYDTAVPICSMHSGRELIQEERTAY